MIQLIKPANMYIRAVSKITRDYFAPTDHNGKHRRNQCQYFLLSNHIHRNTARSILQKGLGTIPEPPFDKNGKLRQGYLFHLSGQLKKDRNCNLFPPNKTQKALSKKSFDLLFPTPIRIK